jgi:hypothetical protein
VSPAGRVRWGRAMVAVFALLVTMATRGCSDDGADRDGAGSITQAGDVNAFTLQVGDCIMLSELASSGDVSDVPAVPCAAPHEAEVYALVDIEAAEDAPFPGTAKIEEIAIELCDSQFEGYVGVPPDASAIDHTPALFPSSASWTDAADREVVCVLFDPEFESLTGTLKGAQR